MSRAYDFIDEYGRFGTRRLSEFGRYQTMRLTESGRWIFGHFDAVAEGITQFAFYMHDRSLTLHVRNASMTFFTRLRSLNIYERE